MHQGQLNSLLPVSTNTVFMLRWSTGEPALSDHLFGLLNVVAWSRWSHLQEVFSAGWTINPAVTSRTSVNIHLPPFVRDHACFFQRVVAYGRFVNWH